MSHGGRRSGGGGPRISYTSRSAPIPINREVRQACLVLSCAIFLSHSTFAEKVYSLSFPVVERRRLVGCLLPFFRIHGGYAWADADAQSNHVCLKTHNGCAFCF